MNKDNNDKKKKSPCWIHVNEQRFSDIESNLEGYGYCWSLPNTTKCQPYIHTSLYVPYIHSCWKVHNKLHWIYVGKDVKYLQARQIACEFDRLVWLGVTLGNWDATMLKARNVEFH